MFNVKKENGGSSRKNKNRSSIHGNKVNGDQNTNQSTSFNSRDLIDNCFICDLFRIGDQEEKFVIQPVDNCNGCELTFSAK